MQNLKSSIPCFVFLLLSMSMSVVSNAQHASTKADISTFPPSIMLAGTKDDNKAKAYKIPLGESKRAMLKLSSTEGCKPSSISSNKAYRFPSLTLSIKGKKKRKN